MANPKSGDLIKEAFDPINALFRDANTDEEYRKATMDGARHLCSTYYVKSGKFTLVDHGPLLSSIKAETGVEIASAADTLLLETRIIETGATGTVMLAVNAPMEGNATAMNATVSRLGDILNEWKQSR